MKFEHILGSPVVPFSLFCFKVTTKVGCRATKYIYIYIHIQGTPRPMFVFCGS